jgi:phosphoenolpyruvate synthase/pyruvate phosphate dikinase
MDSRIRSRLCSNRSWLFLWGRSSPVLSLAEIRDGDAPVVGPKAFVLARMMRARLPVPTGFCIAASNYHQHLEGEGLLDRTREMLARMDAGAAEDQPPGREEIRRSIAEVSLAAGLREASVKRRSVWARTRASKASRAPRRAFASICQLSAIVARIPL